MPYPDLADLQCCFAAQLLQQSLSMDISAMLRNPESVQRFSYYRGNQLANWSAALRNAYPVLLQLVGDDFFEQMAYHYGLNIPSETSDLNQFGNRLPDFLRQSDFVKEYPYFPDVADLEWTLHRAYYAADASLLELDALLASVRQGKDFLAVRLIPHPAAMLYQADFASIPIWRAHQKQAADLGHIDIGRPCAGIITRQGWHASVIELDQLQYRMLGYLFDGQCIGDVLDYALSQNRELDIQGQLLYWLSLHCFSELV
ncbi:HvfC/BufC N-terminal domain-containing protein [Undibacterium oligocarboniphilum]|uniref:Putative DNA-binding domain-containing protein n=1 Tax=Undibacterium oligocarboniphilum TaxID=666702 RepID=A0A850QEC9_9BURK|nr:DNA-binding domain-containing protein [Undibacterium oligocarboniphilum]MBC3871315.1 putative DNA-binding domain-containing protein [Undibacterium oligocarboniphilum]NVO78812.1 putative DNA-binding domain-containing protein [Undibacterium oligocarboniphilum]